MPLLNVLVAAAKIAKYATSESGDTLELIERPRGGLSLVLADGQRSGKAAKSISNIVARKAIALLAEGVRDGAVARAAHDYLSTMRGGKVSATLNIVSVDLATETIVISRNSHCPTVVSQAGQLLLLLITRCTNWLCVPRPRLARTSPASTFCMTRTINRPCSRSTACPHGRGCRQ